MLTAESLPAEPIPAKGIPLSLSLSPSALPLTVSHPQREYIRAMHDQWFLERLASLGMAGDRERLSKNEVPSVIAGMMPQGDVERLLEFTLLGTIGFVIDDLYEASAARRAELQDFVDVCRGADPKGDHRLLRLWAETVARARPTFPPLMWNRAADGFATWAHAFDSRDAIGDYPTYMSWRRTDIGFDSHTVMLEYCLGVDLSELPTSPELEQLHATVVRHLILVNDLWSYRKERAAGDSMNALSILVRGQGMELQNAVDTMCAEINAAEAEYWPLRQALLERDGSDRNGLAIYADAWQYVLGANLGYSVRTCRYHGPDHTWDGTIPRRITLYPDRTVFEGTP